MKYTNGLALKTAQWLSNEILRSDDINYINQSTYMNFTDLYATLLFPKTGNIVAQGFQVMFDTLLAFDVSAGVALSFAGNYMAEDESWGFIADEGSPFLVMAEEAFTANVGVGGASDRVDILEVRPIQTQYNQVNRKFKDPITKVITSSPAYTKIAYTYEVHTIAGSEGASPVAPASIAGWIKIAEIYVPASATSLSQDAVKGVRDSSLWTTEAGTTVMSDPGLGVAVNNTKRPAIDNTIIPKFIGQEYENLALSPTDLTTGNWSIVKLDTPEDSGQIINGKILWKLTVNDDASTAYLQTLGLTLTSNICVYSWIIRKGSLDQVNLDLFGPTESHDDNTTITFSTKDVVSGGGVDTTLLKAIWLDDNTVEVYIRTGVLTGASDYRLRVFVNTGQPLLIGDYCYVSQPQLVDDTTTMFPFVDGIHPADTVNEIDTIEDEQVIDLVLNPKYSYDTSVFHFLLQYYLSASVKLQLNYDASANDRFYVTWQDGGTISYMNSSQFDNGTSYININQRLRIILSLKLNAGIQTGSRFIIIEEDDTVHETILWSTNNPDIKSSILSDLYIGSNNAGGAQADSDYEYLRRYKGLLVGDVNSNSDVEQLLQQKSMIFEAIPDAFISREIEIDTPISSALQQITNDLRTGQGIQDNAILERHNDSSVTRRNVISTDIILQSGKKYLVKNNVELQLPSNPVEGDVIDILSDGYSKIIQNDAEHLMNLKNKYFTTKGVNGFIQMFPGEKLQLIYKGSGLYPIDPFVKLSDPVDLPAGTGSGVAFSDDGVYMAVACGSTPFIHIYKRAGDVFVELPEPDDLPIGSYAYGVSFSHNGVYLAVVSNGTPFNIIYKRTAGTDTFVKLTDPGTLPAGIGRGVAFSEDSKRMVVGHDSTPYATIYNISGDVFTAITTPFDSGPNSSCQAVAFSPDGVYLAVLAGPDYLMVYRRTNDSYIKITGMPTVTSSFALAWSPDSTYLVMYGRNIQRLNIHKRTGDAFVLLEEPEFSPTGEASNFNPGAAFSPNGKYLTIVSNSSALLTTYLRDGDSFDRLTEPSVLPVGACMDVAYSKDGTYLVVGHLTTPFITIYKTKEIIDKEWIVTDFEVMNPENPSNGDNGDLQYRFK